MYNISEETFATLISDYDYHIYEMVNFLLISSVISLFGVVANLMNITVFFKQGFSTMNISLCALAVADVCSLITMLVFNLFMSPLLANPNLGMASNEVQYLIAGLPHLCSIRIGSWITVFMTVERCLCITLPLKIKQLITPRRTTVMVCSIYVLIILSFEPEYETAYYGWKFDVKRNKTILGLLFTSNRERIAGVTYILYSILGFLSFIILIVFTLILVVQLNKMSEWRMKATVEKSQESISNRDRKAVTMVVMISTLLIACYTPGVAVSSVTFFDSEFTISGKHKNVFFAAWSFVVIFESFNSSVNIFLYYYMSSKYRQTFRLVFARCSSHLSTF